MFSSFLTTGVASFGLILIEYCLNNEFNLEEINKLKVSIERREKLLSNENYVNKAPANIVEMDRKKLEEEKEKLRVLENK